MAKWIEIVEEYEEELDDCPRVILNYLGIENENAPGCDRKTVKRNKNSNAVGCRGITCTECWNQQEVKR